MDTAYNEPRRRDRGISDEAWIEEFLIKGETASLAFLGNNKPLQNLNIFAYSPPEKAIYFHTASRGMTAEQLSESIPVSVGLFSVGRWLPAKKALEFSVEYASVIAIGAGATVYGDEATKGLQLILDKYFPHLKAGVDYENISEEELKRTAVFKVVIESWSGKMKKAEENFPGSFYREYNYPFNKN
jgi:nitroimidazol reductase NimA-like FMN-containing flavoprotein (pyridoxamine 5'-phosphate oxidase superfamily)